VTKSSAAVIFFLTKKIKVVTDYQIGSRG